MRSIWQDPDKRRLILFVAAVVLVLLILLCLFIAILCLWPMLGVLIAFLLVTVVVERLWYRTQGAQPDSILQRVCGAFVGAFAGGIVGIAYVLFLIVAYETAVVAPVPVSAVCGCVIGMICPRLVIGLVALLIRLFSSIC